MVAICEIELSVHEEAVSRTARRAALMLLAGFTAGP